MVKRAYLDQALRFHPDRQQDRSDAAQASAAYRMREVNDAWAVLRNPASRARYDDELAVTAGTSSAPGPSSARAAAGSSTWSGRTATDHRLDDVLREPQVADLDRDDGRVVARRPSSTGRTWAPIIIGGVVLALILVFTAYAQNDEPTADVRTVEAYAVGTCVVVGFSPALANPTEGEQAREAVLPVPCDQPGARRIEDRVPFPKPCPSGTSAQLLPDTTEALCLR